jgi:hypothetical protein
VSKDLVAKLGIGTLEVPFLKERHAKKLKPELESALNLIGTALDFIMKNGLDLLRLREGADAAWGEITGSVTMTTQVNNAGILALAIEPFADIFASKWGDAITNYLFPTSYLRPGKRVKDVGDLNWYSEAFNPMVIGFQNAIDNLTKEPLKFTQSAFSDVTITLSAKLEIEVVAFTGKMRK